MAEVPFRPARQLSECKGKGASASREDEEIFSFDLFIQISRVPPFTLQANTLPQFLV